MTGYSHIDHGQYVILLSPELKYNEYEFLNKNDYGEDKRIYWALYTGGLPELHEAINNALDKEGGLFMKNLKVYYESCT